MRLLADIGPDTVINAFAVNRKGNKDINDCNEINEELYKRLSIPEETPRHQRLPLILTHSKLPAHMHGEAASHFKERLGVCTDI